MTFDVLGTVHVGRKYDWQNWFETFSVCRNCKRPTIFIISQTSVDFFESLKDSKLENVKGSLNPHFDVERFISLVDRSGVKAPDHTPDAIAKIFAEAAACLTIQCWNATGAMLRLCVDLATKGLLPTEETPGLNSYTRKTLAPRLAWLLDNGRLPGELRDLSTCIREDGNDAAHDGTLEKADAEDLLDFTVALFERLYTEPERLRLAKERREKRRSDGD
jgi:hypothetical protein